MKQSNTYKELLLFLSVLLLLNSCASVKPLRRDMQNIQTDLGYEMTTPEYKGEIQYNVVLNELSASNMDVRTDVKRTSNICIPLLFVNYLGANFRVRLGEQSLKRPYRDFLKDALLSECNSSAKFNLIDKMPDNMPIDSMYILDVKMKDVDTQANIRYNNTLMILPILDNSGVFEFANYKSKTAQTSLIANVTLCYGTRCLFQKEYEITYNKNRGEYANQSNEDVALNCMDNMAFSLSQATKQLVENISQEIDLVLQSQNK